MPCYAARAVEVQLTLLPPAVQSLETKKSSVDIFPTSLSRFPDQQTSLLDSPPVHPPPPPTLALMPFFLPLFLGGILLSVNVSHTVFTEMASNSDGTTDWSPSSAVLMCEFVKLLLAIVFLARAYFSETAKIKSTVKYQMSQAMILKLSVPGLLYSASNILSLVALGLLGSTSYQLFANMKTVVTAAVFRIIMKKKLKVIQWVCIVALSVGLLVATSTPECPACEGGATTGASEAAVVSTASPRFVSGVFMMVLNSFCASTAGVYTELQLKTLPQHPMLQNCVLYCWTCLFCLIKFGSEGDMSAMSFSYGEVDEHGVAQRSFFTGFNFALWVSIFTHAAYGLVVSLVFFYCDNIVKVFANSATVVASAVADRVFFSRPLSAQMWIAGFIVGASTVVYYGDHAILLKDDDEVLRQLCGGGREDVEVGEGEGEGEGEEEPLRRSPRTPTPLKK